MTLAMFAVTHANLMDEPESAQSDPRQNPIAVSANEIFRLFALLTRPPLHDAHSQHWS
ncbi:hypothetical protein [Acrocarpospora sp. B8E8]|uniref:hypothetical protein n=1 Tax=Acrocarpospora sp. B8E8 TaxID=3153572 RepID=UPI00325F0870